VLVIVQTKYISSCTLHCCSQDKSGLEMQLGVTATGLIVFQNCARVNTFSW